MATTSAAAALALTASTAWALITPVKVLSLPAVQILPFSNDAYLAYASNSTGHPNHYNADAYRYSDHKIRRLNAAHTQGYDVPVTGGRAELGAVEERLEVDAELDLAE